MRFLMLMCLGLAVSAADWLTLYDMESGFRLPTGWIGPQTRSERTAEGLHLVDPSTAPGSGRLYIYPWQMDAALGATVEVRLRVIAASEAWGCCVNVADGSHEEDVSFFPDRVRLSYAGIEAPFPAGDGQHVYRVEVKAPDLRVWADGRLLLDGTGKFSAPVLTPGRNRVAFGCSSSGATSESVWQYVRVQGGKPPGALRQEPPTLPGLEVRRGRTVSIVPNASYRTLFRYADGALQVGEKRSSDGGVTWAEAKGPAVGALQLASGEVIELDYRTHASGEPGWFTSALSRWSASGAPLPTLKARLHVPEFVTTIDDDGSRRDGPWCDHAIVQLRDGSLLAANSGCFAADTTPVSSYQPEWGARKYRGFVCRSSDGGLTWEYLSTVTADPTLGSEGCNEMDLVRAPNGDLLCLFRTGGSPDHPSPLCQCRSRDEGRTWEPPQRVAAHGVWPNACLLPSGVLVCTYGRPGQWLTFSLDSGQTWVGSFCFDDSPGSGYNSVDAVAPDTILVTYDVGGGIDPDGNPGPSAVCGTWFTVRRP